MSNRELYGRHVITTEESSGDRVYAECQTCGWAASAADYNISRKIDAHCADAFKSES